MSGAATRIGALILRYGYLHKRSLPRTLEIIFWPVMELLVWGFVSVYIQSLAGDALSRYFFSEIEYGRKRHAGGHECVDQRALRG